MSVAIEQLTTLGLTPWSIWALSPHPLNEESGGWRRAGDRVLEGLGIPRQLIRVTPAHIREKPK